MLGLHPRDPWPPPSLDVARLRSMPADPETALGHVMDALEEPCIPQQFRSEVTAAVYEVKECDEAMTAARATDEVAPEDVRAWSERRGPTIWH